MSKLTDKFSRVTRNDSVTEQTNYMVTSLLGTLIAAIAGMLAGTIEAYIVVLIFAMWTLTVFVRSIDRDNAVRRQERAIENLLKEARGYAKIEIEKQQANRERM